MFLLVDNANFVLVVVISLQFISAKSLFSFFVSGVRQGIAITNSTEIVEEVTEEPIVTVEENVEFRAGFPRLKYTWANQGKEQKVLRKQYVLK